MTNENNFRGSCLFGHLRSKQYEKTPNNVK